MKAITGLVYMVSAFWLGVVLSASIHELGHALFALMVGGSIDWIRLFPVKGRPAAVFISQLSDPKYAFVACGGMLASTTAGIVLAHIMPWQKLGRFYSAGVAVALLAFALNPLPLVWCPWSNFGDAVQLKLYIPASMLALIGCLWVAGTLWLWWKAVPRMRSTLLEG